MPPFDGPWIYTALTTPAQPQEDLLDVWEYEHTETIVMDIALCNVSGLFQCLNGNCVNFTVTCNGKDDCLDGTDESNEHGLCSDGPNKLLALEVAAIVIGCIVGTVILCCLLGTIIDCFMHVYKYWCSCLHKAYHCPSEMVALRTPNGGPAEPTVLVVRAIPPSYSTIIVSCEAASRLAAHSRDAADSNHVTVLTEESLSRSGTPTQETSLQTMYQRVLSPSPPNSPEHHILLKLNDIHSKKEISTQTSSPLLTRSTGTCTRPDSVRLLCGGAPPSAAHGQTPTSPTATSPILEGTFLPPSYSSIFRNDYVTYASDTPHQATEGFLTPPS